MNEKRPETLTPPHSPHCTLRDTMNRWSTCNEEGRLFKEDALMRFLAELNYWQAGPMTEREPNAGLPYGIIDPEYARFYTQARCVAHQYGWCVSLHGSFTRDLDLLLTPWTDKSTDHVPVLNLIAEVTGTIISGEPREKPHGRLAYTFLMPSFADRRWVDISVMPRIIPVTTNEENET